MAIRRVHRTTERTPEEQAEIDAVREQFQRDRPTEEELLATGDYSGPHQHGDVLALLSSLASIKRERERRGLTLTEVSEASGLDKGMLSRLENGKILNPTISTLHRYAAAVGLSLALTVQESHAPST
jgi:hypothetical protein